MDQTAENFIKKLETFTSRAELKNYHRYFQFDEHSKEGDQFMGVRMGKIFNLAKDYLEMPISEIEKLLENPFHEVRVGAVSIMDYISKDKKSSLELKKEIFDLYLRRHDRINTWDLVDRSAINVVGGYLFDKPRDILYKLAKSGFMPERRTALVSTFYFIKKGDFADSLKIAEILVHDEEDLIHKAAGWVLRTIGGKDLLDFLDKYAAKMPRVMLRYSIEKLSKSQKEHYMNLKNA